MGQYLAVFSLIITESFGFLISPLIQNFFLYFFTIPKDILNLFMVF